MPFLFKTTKWAALVLVASVGVAATVLIWEPRADQPENARPTTSADPPGTFRPTQLQWRNLKLEPVVTRAFRPEQVTEGTIAVDDDLTTPVYSHYSGRVIKVIARFKLSSGATVAKSGTRTSATFIAAARSPWTERA